ncbi:threonine/serine ThrE exporter family protein [Marinicella meishanensis]|uniref:threonine/serine ThrE exporter family protein n=1 Tax=Marinicella meishanensis TaxID=2873263 RepID=UPI001CBBA03D|nr:threonine/serine exporter family protein [Marinicella sp. NBU2979]
MAAEKPESLKTVIRKRDRETRRKQANILLKICRAISEAGAPAHRLESYMQVIADKFELEASFFAMPTAVLASIGEDEYNQRSYMIKTNPNDINLNTMHTINSVINQLENDELDLDVALHAIKDITSKPAEYPNWLFALCFGLVGSGFTTLFSGSWHDVAVAGLLGLVTGIITIYSAPYKYLSQLLAPMAAMVVGFLAVSISHYWQTTDHFLVSLAGLIILVPGLGITVAMRELSTGHLVSGSSRMAGAVTTLFLLSFGLALGYLIAQTIYGETQVNQLPGVPEWFTYLALVITALCFSVLFKSRMADTFWIFLSIGLAYSGSSLIGLWIEQPFKSLVAVMLISVAGNIYSRLSSNPASVMHIPGIILLVPGSIGFNSLSAMYTNDTMTGVQAAFNAVLIAVAISVGLLVGNLLVPPKKEL